MWKTIRQIAREPFFQFVVLGIILFILVSQWERHTNKATRTIVVDHNRVNMMIVNYNNQNGRLPTKEQLDALIEGYILEEITYREALKMELDQDDEIIRRRLSQKYQFIQTDLTEIPAPTESDLQQFYADHPSLFQQEETVSFSHVYFSTDHSNDSIASQRAHSVLMELKQSKVTQAPEKGDRFPLQYDYTDQSVLDVQQNFGDKPLLDTLMNGSIKTWHGPVPSGYGWHLVYVIDRSVVSTIPYETIREDVKTKFLEEAKAGQNKKAMDDLLGQYTIERAYLSTK